MLNVGVIGASGYTGVELMRILWGHPEMRVELTTANQYVGEPVSRLYPSLAGFYQGAYETFDLGVIIERCDIVFSCLPHGESLKVVPELVDSGMKVVDLSADFRLKDAGEYQSWYGVVHTATELLEKAAYGLPEINREAVAAAGMTANPGCFPTGALIGMFPAAAAGLVDGTVIVDSKSGVSGAGRKLTLATHFPQTADSIEPYGVMGHRHLPEIRSQFRRLVGDAGADILFIPHLVPMNRGILSTIYIPLTEGHDYAKIRGIYEQAYEGEPFIHLLPSGSYPVTKAVQGSNNCHVGIAMPGCGKTLVVITAIDNLVKGASGEAVQNMNLMCGLPEEMGLAGPALFP